MSRFDDAMRRLSVELAEAEVPARLEDALLAEFDRAALLRAKRRRGAKWIGAAGALAVASGIAILLVHSRPQPKPAEPMAVEMEAERPFIPIPYVLPPAPYERVEVVRMQVPVAALIAAGLPMQTDDPGAQAEADVLVGQDGRPRAVRLLSIFSFN